MKNILTILLVTLSASLFSQETKCCDKKESNISYYASVGLSMSNTYDTTFSFSSYPSIEFGGMYENIGVGVCLGRGNLSGFNNDQISNYWYEFKVSASQEIGLVSGYVLFGLGNYITTKRMFIEYGGGISYAPNKFGIFTQVSNWDGTWYLTPGLVYNF